MKKAYLTAFFAAFLVVSVSAQRSFIIPVASTQPSLLTASAGEVPSLVGSDLVLGDMPPANGGVEPYTYQWLPAENLDDPNSPNPVFIGVTSANYTLVITDGRGCSAADTLQIIILGLSESTDYPDLKVYPNPGSGRIQIQKPEQLMLNQTKIKLFDAGGKLLIDAAWVDPTKDSQIDISRLSSGQYLLILDDSSKKVSAKIIIQ